MLRTDIGNGVDALLCTTDRAGCCRPSDGQRAGEFYFPDGTLVPILGADPSIRTYYRSRGSRFVSLNRINNGMETGQFCCEIPDASGTTVNLFINIGRLITSQIEYSYRQEHFLYHSGPTTNCFTISTSYYHSTT